MTGYTKLFSSILMSSIWEESTETRLVWVTLLALSDQHGHVDGTVKSLARVSRVSLKDCQKALECLLGPDADDRSGNLDGRRIVTEQGGWRLVNYAAYRARMSAEERRERDRLRKRNQRVSARSPHLSENVRDFQQAEAEAEAEEKQEPPDALRARFERWWESYPRKVGKGAARSLWLKLKPSEALTAQMIAAVEDQRQSPQWLKDGGQYIPHARTWLSQSRWEDERPESPQEREARLALAQAEAEFEKWKAQGHPAYTPFATFQEFQQRRRA